MEEKKQNTTATADVGGKKETTRHAVAVATVSVSVECAELIRRGKLPKGDALLVARIAGIQAAKQTPALIPYCHPTTIDYVSVETEVERGLVKIRAEVRGRDRTGFEMEALTAAAVAALTIYDMVKQVEMGARIDGVRLVEKSGGKHGHVRLEGKE